MSPTDDVSVRLHELDWGFVNRVVDDPSEVVATALDLARSVAANPEFAVNLTKEMVRSTAPSLREAVLLENRTQVLAVFAGDIDHAMTQFRSAPSGPA